jgi:hypothetical protein
MPTVPVGFAAIVIPFKHPDSPREAVITFGVDADPSLTTGPEVAAAVWLAFHTSIRGVVDSAVALGPVRGSYNVGGGPIPFEGDDEDNGAVAMAALPCNSALLVKKRSLLSGRANRGRYYIPWCLEESVVGEFGQIGPTTITDHQAIQDEFLTALTTEGVPMVILHNGPGTPAGVSSLTVDPVIGTQRRRIGR